MNSSIDILMEEDANDIRNMMIDLEWTYEPSKESKITHAYLQVFGGNIDANGNFIDKQLYERAVELCKFNCYQRIYINKRMSKMNEVENLRMDRSSDTFKRQKLG